MLEEPLLTGLSWRASSTTSAQTTNACTLRISLLHFRRNYLTCIITDMRNNIFIKLFVAAFLRTAKC